MRRGRSLKGECHCEAGEECHCGHSRGSVIEREERLLFIKL